MSAWDDLGLPRDYVELVLADNARYCAMGYIDHLAAFFCDVSLQT